MAPPPSAPERASQVWAWPSMTGFGPVAATASSVAIAAVMVAALLADGLRTGTIGLQAPWLALSDLMYMCCFFAVAQWLLLASWSSGYRLTSVAARPQFDSSRLRSCVPVFLRSSSRRFLVSLVETRRHLLLAHLSFFGLRTATAYISSGAADIARSEINIHLHAGVVQPGKHHSCGSFVARPTQLRLRGGGPNPKNTARRERRARRCHAAVPPPPRQLPPKCSPPSPKLLSFVSTHLFVTGCAPFRSGPSPKSNLTFHPLCLSSAPSSLIPPFEARGLQSTLATLLPVDQPSPAFDFAGLLSSFAASAAAASAAFLSSSRSQSFSPDHGLAICNGGRHSPYSQPLASGTVLSSSPAPALVRRDGERGTFSGDVTSISEISSDAGPGADDDVEGAEEGPLPPHWEVDVIRTEGHNYEGCYFFVNHATLESTLPLAPLSSLTLPPRWPPAGLLRQRAKHGLSELRADLPPSTPDDEADDLADDLVDGLDDDGAWSDYDY